MSMRLALRKSKEDAACKIAEAKAAEEAARPQTPAPKKKKTVAKKTKKPTSKKRKVQKHKQKHKMQVFGVSKQITNKYLSANTIPNQHMLVMDTASLGSARILAQTHAKKLITVFGTAKKLPSNSKRYKVKCEAGWSSSVLQKVCNNKYGLIYLDFMCTPDGGNYNFNPLDDMERASKMLNQGGILAVTFSKRCRSVVSKCINICPKKLYLQRSFEYKDSSAMIFLVYSTRSLPAFGPPLGSLVSVMCKRKRKIFGKVNRVMLDGVGLVEMVKKGNTYKKKHKKKQKLWEEPFDAIQTVQ